MDIKSIKAITFVCILLWIIILLFLYIVYKLLKKYELSITKAQNNSLYCGKTRCPVLPKNLDIPDLSIQTYNKDIAKYCADLVNRLEFEAKGEIYPPSNLKRELDLYISHKDFVFGIIWSYLGNVFIVLRGTLEAKEFLDDFNYKQEEYTLTPTNNKTMIHSGFLNVYKRIRDDIQSVVKRLNPNRVIVTGHSLGAAISTICGLDLKEIGYNTIVYNFASPRIGDINFKNIVNNNIFLYRIVNISDTIPTLPPAVSSNFNDSNKPYFYYHVGTPIIFEDNWKSLINNHLLAIYINYLDK